MRESRCRLWQWSRSSGLCVAISTAASGRRSSAAQRRPIAPSSSDRVGSSSTRTRGVPRRARASADLLEHPGRAAVEPLLGDVRDLELLLERAHLLDRAAAAWMAELGEEEQVLAARQPQVEGALLRQRRADEPVRCFASGDVPGDLDLARSCGSSAPVMHRRTVVLPEPLGPRSATRSPAATFRSRLRDHLLARRSCATILGPARIGCSATGTEANLRLAP